MNSYRGGRSRAAATLAAVAVLGSVGIMPNFDTARASSPGDNGRIAFQSSRDGNWEIYVMKANGNDRVNITNSPRPDYHASWSPDGRRIAFVRGTPYRDIWVMSADGANATNLTPGFGAGEGGIEPAWSPDGSRIAYHESHEIWSMAPDGSDKVNLTSTPAGVGIEMYPTYSPDGSLIAMIRNQDLWVMKEDGSDPVQLTSTSGQFERSPDWSPDGARLVFQRGGEIWTMDPDGGNATAIVSSPRGGVNPAWSPDGSRIVFASNGFGARDGYDIFTMNPDGTDVRLLDPTPNRSGDNPHWQPVVHATDLAVTMTDSRDPVRVDRKLTYTIEITNFGPVDARLVSAYSVLPFGTKFDSVTSSKGTCRKVRASLTCNLGKMAVGAVATIRVTVVPIAFFDLTYRVDITSSSGDTNPANDFAVEKTQVLPPLGGDPEARINWEVPNRLRDYDGDGFIDEERFNNPNATVPAFEMTILGCDSSPVGHVTNYDFEVTFPTGGDPLRQSSPDCRFSFNPPQEGIYEVKLTITNEDGEQATGTRDVPFKDHFIVSIGDSVGSGEGNPEVICDQGCHWWDPPAKWQDRRCHRSSKSGPSRAALAIEETDPTTSVTFTHLACSGGQITEGILHPYRGIEPPDDDSFIPPQANVLRTLMQQWGRKPDAVLISVGANDASFSDAVARCILPDRCQNDEDFVDFVRRRMRRLSPRFTLLGEKLAELGIEDRRVFITEYFDPTHNEFGKFVDCHARFTYIYPSEWEWAKLNVIDKLNENVNTAANRKRHSWHVVGGIPNAFTKHGYCANSASRWIVRLDESIDRQGNPSGAFHPNGPGHLLYGSYIVNILKPRLP